MKLQNLSYYQQLTLTFSQMRPLPVRNIVSQQPEVTIKQQKHKRIFYTMKKNHFGVRPLYTSKCGISGVSGAATQGNIPPERRFSRRRNNPKPTPEKQAS